MVWVPTDPLVMTRGAAIDLSCAERRLLVPLNRLDPHVGRLPPELAEISANLFAIHQEMRQAALQPILDQLPGTVLNPADDDPAYAGWLKAARNIPECVEDTHGFVEPAAKKLAYLVRDASADHPLRGPAASTHAIAGDLKKLHTQNAAALALLDQRVAPLLTTDPARPAPGAAGVPGRAAFLRYRSSTGRRTTPGGYRL